MRPHSLISAGGAILELTSIASLGPGSCARSLRALTLFGAFAKGGIFVSPSGGGKHVTSPRLSHPNPKSPIDVAS